MKTPTQDERKEFCQLAGVHWHEWDEWDGNMIPSCKLCDATQLFPWSRNPTFEHPEDVLKAIEEHPRLTANFLITSARCGKYGKRLVIR